MEKGMQLDNPPMFKSLSDIKWWVIDHINNFSGVKEEQDDALLREVNRYWEK